MKKVIIIGGGPSALMLAAELDTTKYHVTLHEKKKTVGRKFLVAGEGGLNLTYNEPLSEFINNFYPTDFMAPYLERFSNEDLIKWLNTKGIKTFVGSSNRVFPESSLKPIDVLNKLVDLITRNNVNFELESNWLGWNKEGQLLFEGKDAVPYDIAIFALGGASWEVTGSDGTWKSHFEKQGINVLPFRAANCAFSVEWGEKLLNTHEGKPLKNITATYKNQVSTGELTISNFGLEGNAIYPLSRKIQDALLTEKVVTLHIDLKPTFTVDQIKEKLKHSKLSKTTDILKEDLNLDRTAVGVLKYATDKNTFLDNNLLAEAIKSLPIQVNAADEIDKAISTLGGIDLKEVDTNFQLKKMPNTYVIGEMLDWYAPTGGYLLQGCFSMGFALANHLNQSGKTYEEEE